MLNYLKIKNLALIANAGVEFAPGFNVVTGESGSGKTVLLNTIALLTGKRADKNLLRAGCSRCELAAEITVDAARNPEIIAELEASGIEFEAAPMVTIQLRRTFTAGGNRNFLNDTPVNIVTLKRIGDLLIDVHGANEHHTLLHRSRQLELLDRFGNLQNLHGEYKKYYEQLKALKQERDSLLSDLPDADEAEMLRGIVSEIAAVDPQPDEDTILAERHKIAANAHTIVQIVSASIMELGEGDNSLLDTLSGIYRKLAELPQLGGAETENFLTDLELIRESIENLVSALEIYSGKIELDEESFAELEKRLSEIYTLKRHYGPTLESVLLRRAEAEKRLQLVKDFAQKQKEFAERIAAAEADLTAAAGKLSDSRKAAAAELSARVSEKLKVLGFEYNAFSIDFASREPDLTGIDTVDMIFSANPGLNPAPLRLIASSGEIARVMLALKAVLADADAVPVLIFDEIDVNIGGETGVRVGEELLALSTCRQLLCISHLPQVAAKAQHHYAVSKHIENGEVFGTIKLLDKESRVGEIARMLGGTEAARHHARSLLKD
ncbi:MAG: DNA repair protein RecN [Lentisphaerae bacterium]|nr:DNA repair protein RecN [Lentisphaerota bacterium]